MKIECTNYTQIALVAVVCMTLIIAYYLYIDHQIKMATDKPNATNKITIRVLAGGFTMAYSIMLFPTSREALDFQLYGLKIELYALIKAIIFLGMLGFGLITGGTALSTLIKGKVTDE
jgi:uncharacterized membrane protein YedE/YeeE